MVVELIFISFMSVLFGAITGLAIAKLILIGRKYNGSK